MACRYQRHAGRARDATATCRARPLPSIFGHLRSTIAEYMLLFSGTQGTSWLDGFSISEGGRRCATWQSRDSNPFSPRVIHLAEHRERTLETSPLPPPPWLKSRTVHGAVRCGGSEQARDLVRAVEWCVCARACDEWDEWSGSELRSEVKWKLFREWDFSEWRIVKDTSYGRSQASRVVRVKSDDSSDSDARRCRATFRRLSTPDVRSRSFPSENERQTST